MFALCLVLGSQYGAGRSIIVWEMGVGRQSKEKEVDWGAGAEIGRIYFVDRTSWWIPSAWLGGLYILPFFHTSLIPTGHRGWSPPLKLPGWGYLIGTVSVAVISLFFLFRITTCSTKLRLEPLDPPLVSRSHHSLLLRCEDMSFF